MLKLSRRHWNNILIFVVLLLMYSLYDWSADKRASSAMVVQLIPEQASLLSVAVADRRLVNVAGQWRLQPAGPGTVAAEQMAHAWRYTLLQPLPGAVAQGLTPVAQASVQVAGEFTPHIWLLYPYQQAYAVQKVGQPQLYLLSVAQARLLFLLE